MTPRIYVACLASYNAGKLHGAWIDVAGKSPKDLQNEIDVMLIASPVPNAEEYGIHDTEDLPCVSEFTHLGYIVEAAEIISEHGELGAAVLKHHNGTLKYANDALNNYQGTYSDLVDYVASYLDDTGFFADVPEHFRSYFDFEAYARDMELGGDVYTIDVPEGVAVFANS